MNFISWPFWGLVVATVALVSLGRTHGRLPWRMAVIWVASYVFYAAWQWTYLGVLLISTTTDYFLSHGIAQSNRPAVRKTLLWLGISLNLGILGLFKYAEFITTNLNGWLNWCGVHGQLPEALHLILPLGISFYTFEAISYLVDVYRGDNPPAPSWWRYNAFIMYFPHLIAGPIIRFHHLYEQYAQGLARPNLDRLVTGAEMVVVGCVLKIAIADTVAPWADMVFEAPMNHSPLVTLIGTLAFTVQILGDFWGYTQIARGVSLWLNLSLPLNFNFPYNAANIQDFWRRWHISLSTWIRDYVFIPLGGSKNGDTPRSYGPVALTILATMGLAGLWHGAGWTFVLWGVFHGLLLVIHRGWRLLLASRSRLQAWTVGPIYHGSAVALTFAAASLGWVLFRSPYMSTAQIIYGNLFNLAAWGKAIAGALPGQWVQLEVLLLLALSGPLWAQMIERHYRPWPLWGKQLVWTATLLLCWLLTQDASHPFIYFQF
jgi:alginate O-acetyltransferase complex protein AlgI